jgi:hypothetical protein
MIAWDTKSVPEFCTCGAKLAEDALFCHKCGKPQRDYLPEDDPQPPAITPIVVLPPPIPQLPPIGLSNGLAVRIGIAACLLATLLFMISVNAGVPQLALLWFLGAGFFSVSLYVQRTGQPLSPISGARLGWIAGLFLFALFTIMLSIGYMLLNDPAMMDAFRERSKSQQMSEKDLMDSLEMMRRPAGIIALLVSMFLSLTTLPAIGGAIGAKFFKPRNS